MKKRAFTVVEVLVAVVLLGLITLSLFPLVVAEVRKTNNAFEITKDGFAAQTKIENEIKALYETSTVEDWSDDKAELKISMFGVDDIPVLAKTMQTEGHDIGTDSKYQGRVLVIIPKDLALKTNSPEVMVKLRQLDSNRFQADVTYKKIKGTKKSWKEEVEFCVYRWYVGNYKGPTPDLSTLTVVREYNISKNAGAPSLFNKFNQFKYQLKGDFVPGTITYDTVDYSIIADGPYAYLDGNAPLIDKGLKKDKLDGDNFRLDSLNMSSSPSPEDFTEEEKEHLYGGKGLVFSAMPVTKNGEVGKEVFSEMIAIDLEREKLQLAMDPMLQTYGTDAYLVKFILKQVNNVDLNKSYYLAFRGLSDNKIYYPHYSTADNFYYLRTTYPSGSLRPVKVDGGGLAQFGVLIPKGQDYEMGIGNSSNVLLAADLDLEP